MTNRPPATFTFTLVGVFEADNEDEARDLLAEWLTIPGVFEGATVAIELPEEHDPL